MASLQKVVYATADPLSPENTRRGSRYMGSTVHWEPTINRMLDRGVGQSSIGDGSKVLPFNDVREVSAIENGNLVVEQESTPFPLDKSMRSMI